MQDDGVTREEFEALKAEVATLRAGLDEAGRCLARVAEILNHQAATMGDVIALADEWAEAGRRLFGGMAAPEPEPATAAVGD